jgi:hypothetical protein
VLQDLLKPQQWQLSLISEACMFDSMIKILVPAPGSL